jgi:predicted enzyme related to lactoylglutathione lyase
VMDPTPIPGVGDIAMFQDPEGNCIGLYKEHQAAWGDEVMR